VKKRIINCSHTTVLEIYLIADLKFYDVTPIPWIYILGSFAERQTFQCRLSTMPKSVLVTGATGLLGRQVVTAFERESWTVTGTGYSRAKPPSTLKVDLGSQAEVTKVLDEVK
jgi:hypothetical protein